MTNRRFPVAGSALTIPQGVARAAWFTYREEHRARVLLGGEKSFKEWELQGGFTPSELDAWAPGWREYAR